MPSAPEGHPGAVRQTWRAALCLAAVAGAALAAWHAAPDQAEIGRFGVLLALGAAGFATTRLAMAAPDGTPALRKLADIWAALALGGLPALIVVIFAVLLAGVALSPPTDLRGQAWTALWTAAGVSGAELLKQGGYDPRTGDNLLMHGWLAGVAAQLALGWSLAVVLLRRFGLTRGIAAAAGLAALASFALDIAMRRQGFDLQAFFLSPARAWPFLIGAAAAAIPKARSEPVAGPMTAAGGAIQAEALARVLDAGVPDAG